MRKSFSELIQLCHELGLPTSGSESRLSLAKVLRQHLSDFDSLPHIDRMDAVEIRPTEIPEDAKFIAEEKLDGVRCRLHRMHGRTRFSTTTISDITFGFGEVHCLPEVKLNIPDGTILEGELIWPGSGYSHLGGQVRVAPLQMVTSLLSMRPEEAIDLQKAAGTFLQFCPFDALVWANENLIDVPFHQRSKRLKDIQYISNSKPVRSAESNFREFFEKVVAEGGEGIMLKDITAAYRPGQRCNAWIKVKKLLTMDAFVSAVFASPKQRVAGLEFSSCSNDGNCAVIARIANISGNLRTKIADGSIQPIGMVAEISGQEWSHKSKRLTHARIVRFRDDLSIADLEATHKYAACQC
jgi:ATP-dependent DNA ligase